MKHGALSKTKVWHEQHEPMGFQNQLDCCCCCCCCCGGCGGCCWTSKNSSLNQKTVWCFEVQDFDHTIAGSRDGKPVVYGDVDMM